MPAALAWGTLALLVFLSWKTPFFAAFFIITFDTYWLFKTVYLSLHLRASFKKMRENQKINWLERLKNLRWENVHHLVILPMYREPYEIVRETLLSLTTVNYPKNKLIIVLALEERGGVQDLETAKKIQEEFSGKFLKFLTTVHPANLSGEIPGKGSNETFAAKEVRRQIIDPLKISYENILVSVFDADTQVGKEYFGILTFNFLTTEKPQRSSYQPIPLFTNNIYQAPALGRVISFSATFWHMMQQARPEQLTTFSSHSMPFKALVEIGFWQTDIVSEDSRIFWQCYFHYNGDWRTVPLFYPVTMDANVAPTFWETMTNIYKQQRRWGWGVENIPYILGGFVKNKSITFKSKLSWSFKVIESFHSWATNALIIFFLGWLPVFIGGREFDFSVIAYNLPEITRFIMLLASVGIISSAILSLVLLPPRPSWFKAYHWVLYVIQWALMPITLILFGSLPGLDSQTRLMLGGKFRLGFWKTPKIRK